MQTKSLVITHGLTFVLGMVSLAWWAEVGVFAPAGISAAALEQVVNEIKTINATNTASTTGQGNNASGAEKQPQSTHPAYGDSLIGDSVDRVVGNNVLAKLNAIADLGITDLAAAALMPSVEKIHEAIDTVDEVDLRLALTSVTGLGDSDLRGIAEGKTFTKELVNNLFSSRLPKHERITNLCYPASGFC